MIENFIDSWKSSGVVVSVTPRLIPYDEITVVPLGPPMNKDERLRMMGFVKIIKNGEVKYVSIQRS